jgi:hypothetical protein
MKTPALLLIVSLVANGALVAALARRSPAPRSSAPVSTTASSATTTTAAAVSPELAATANVNVPVANLWSRLHSDNLDELKHRLQAAGFPPKHVRTLLSLAIHDRMNAEREARLGKPESTPYWKPTWSTDREYQKQSVEIYRQTRALDYQYVSGPDSLVDDEEARIAAQRRFGKLPLEKLQQLTSLERDAEDLQMKLSAQSTGPMDDEAVKAARDAYQALEKEKMAQLAQILTPAELEQYELRGYQAAGLARQLSAFQPTEDEFKLIYALEKSFRQTVSDRTLTPAQRSAKSEEQQALITAALGEERAADYLAVSQAGSDNLPLLIARLELPLSTLGAINTVRTDINQRAQAIGNDPKLTAVQRDSQLAALAREANEKLTATLGSKRGYDAYMDLKGDWVRALTPRK